MHNAETNLAWIYYVFIKNILSYQ